MIQDATEQAAGSFQLPLIALEQQVLFPNVLSIVDITDQRQRQAAQHAHDHNQTLIACKLKAPEDHRNEAGDLLEHLHVVGTEVAPLRFNSGDSGGSGDSQLLVQGRRRVRILDIDDSGTYPIASAQAIAPPAFDQAEIEPLTEALLELFKQASKYKDTMTDEVIKHILDLQDPGTVCDSIAALLPLPLEDLQNQLEEEDLQQRLQYLEDQLRQDLRDSELHEEVHSRLKNDIAAHQREAYLREQLRVIQQELSESDLFQQETHSLTKKIDQACLPEEVQQKAMKELSRLSVVPPMSPEFGVIHGYLDRLLALPWQKFSKENLDLEHAEEILERAHYGLKKVKARILEQLAVRKLAGSKMKSPILCFVGPPGVGKTSLGKSIADALGCKFLRISLGGVHDEAEIRGHRRTYIGSMPGRILQQMERAETINPVFMLDEIDKISSDFRGDPASALLEVLDPEQNRQFVDHYMEVPYDLSHVTFIATANELYSIPEALEDRLEVIEFKGYTEEEKIQIARRFLLPRQLKANGITDVGIQFSTPALQHIIRHYTYESGVRSLEREIASICRKAARQVASNGRHPRRISPTVVEKRLGPPRLIGAKVNRDDAVGVASGLVWTPQGGEIQTVEVTLATGKGSTLLTGQLGDVLQESAHIALSYLRARAQAFALAAEDFDNTDIHVHMPEGAVPKDGPSAGITLAVALVSAFTERAVKANYAMSGEITLRGHVLPVGGVVEKVLAARRRRVVQILLPQDNRKDLRELPAAVKRDITIHFVSSIEEVLERVLHAPPAQRRHNPQSEPPKSQDDA